MSSMRYHTFFLKYLVWNSEASFLKLEKVENKTFSKILISINSMETEVTGCYYFYVKYKN